MFVVMFVVVSLISGSSCCISEFDFAESVVSADLSLIIELISD